MKKLALVVAALLVVLAPATSFALDLSQPIKNFDGKSFVDTNGKPLELTIGGIIGNALLNEQVASREEKDKNYYLARKLSQDNKNYTFTPEELVQIRKALSTTQSTVIYGTVMSLIDPTFMPK